MMDADDSAKNVISDTGLIHIVCSANESFALPLAVTVTSISESVPRGCSAKIFVIDSGLKDQTRIKLQAISQRLRNCDLCFCDANNSAVAKLSDVGGYNTSIFYRLLLGQLLPPDVQKVLYLDCDLIVAGDLTKLWLQDVESHILKGVRDLGVETIGRGIPSYCDNSGLNREAPYFNSGVMLINLRRWREEKIYDLTIAYIQKYSSELIFPDQEALNAVCYGKWEELSPEWNVQVGALIHQSDEARSPYAERMRAQKTVLLNEGFILHFVGNHKPWLAGRYRPVRRRFLHYLYRSQWLSYPELLDFHFRWFCNTAKIAVESAISRISVSLAMV